VTGKEPIQAQSQPHSSVQGNITGAGGDIALSKEGTSEVRFTISEEEAEEEEEVLMGKLMNHEEIDMGLTTGQVDISKMDWDRTGCIKFGS
ncbi:hypothetical protein Tco_0186823, partial [Tanacetum coccineum]